MAQFLGAGSDQRLNALMRSSADHKKRIAEFRSALLQGLYTVGVLTEQISFVGNNNLPALCKLFAVFFRNLFDYLSNCNTTILFSILETCFF